MRHMKRFGLLGVLLIGLAVVVTSAIWREPPGPYPVIDRHHVTQGRLPAEFEEQEFLLLCWSPREDPKVHQTYREIVKHVKGAIKFLLIARDDAHRRFLTTEMEGLEVPSDRYRFLPADFDSRWVRDYAPLPVIGGDVNLLLDTSYLTIAPLRPRDDEIPAAIGREFELPVVRSPITLDGGLILADGEGTCLCSTQIFEQNKFWNYEPEEVIEILETHFRMEEIIFLEPLPDEPTGHLDIFCAVVGPRTAVLSASSRPDVQSALERNAKILEERGWNVERVPTPTTNEQKWGTYTNIMLCNDVVLIPDYPASDPGGITAAMEVYEKLLPNREIVGIDCEALAIKGGELHCISATLPRFSPESHQNHKPLDAVEIEQVVRALGDPRERGQYQLQAQEVIAHHQQQMMTPLLNAQRQGHGEHRVLALYTLAGAEFHRDEQDYLLAAAEDSDWRVRWWSLVALGKSGEEVSPALVDHFQKAGDEQSLMFALRIAGPGAESAMPLIIDGLKSDNPQVRQWAAELIAQFTAIDEKTVDAVRNALKVEGDQQVRRALREAWNSHSG